MSLFDELEAALADAPPPDCDGCGRPTPWEYVTYVGGRKGHQRCLVEDVVTDAV